MVILGLITLFVCTSLDLNDEAPTWATEVLKARVAHDGSPEERAAIHEEKQVRLSPLRFYRWCGAILLVTGVAGFVWQQLQ